MFRKSKMKKNCGLKKIEPNRFGSTIKCRFLKLENSISCAPEALKIKLPLAKFLQPPLIPFREVGYCPKIFRVVSPFPIS